MLIPIALGAICGIAGFGPLYAGSNLARKAAPDSNFGYAGALLLGVLGSFLLLAATLAACIFVQRAAILPFALSEVAMLSVTAIAYGASTLVRR